MRTWHKRLTVALTATVMATTGACSTGPDPGPAEPAVSAPGPSAAPATPDVETSAAPPSGAVEAFRAWLKASRKPDPAAACAGLAPALQRRMIAEINSSGPVRVSTCEQMIAATAQLYRAAGDDGTAEVAVQEESSTAATLVVTYGSSGDCGTVVMDRRRGDWVITEQSQECARR